MRKDYGIKDRDNFMNELKANHFKPFDRKAAFKQILEREFPWVLEKKLDDTAG